MGAGERRSKRRNSSSLESDAIISNAPSPNTQTEAAALKDRKNGIGGPFSDPNFKIWKLQLIIMVDTLGAALVVPLLQTYFGELSTSSGEFGYMRSIYNIAQIGGGLLIGIGSDTIISKRTAIVISSVGAVISYAMVASLHFLPSPLFYLILSRVVIGFAKHSMAAGVGLVGLYVTNPSDRPTSLGRIGAASTFSLIVGPSIGSTLYHIHESLPPLIACVSCALNVLLALWLLPGNEMKLKKELHRTESNGEPKQRGFLRNVRFCARPECLSLVIFQVAYNFTGDALCPSLHLGYYKNRFHVAPSLLGYVRSYKALISLITKALHHTMLGHMVSSMVLTVLSTNIVSTMFECVVMESVPVEVLGSVQAMTRILISSEGVIAPIYGLTPKRYPVAAAVSYMILALGWKANDFIWMDHATTITGKKKKQ